MSACEELDDCGMPDATDTTDTEDTNDMDDRGDLGDIVRHLIQTRGTSLHWSATGLFWRALNGSDMTLSGLACHQISAIVVDWPKGLDFISDNNNLSKIMVVHV